MFRRLIMYSVCAGLTQLYLLVEYSVFYIRYNYMFRRLIMYSVCAGLTQLYLLVEYKVFST